MLYFTRCTLFIVILVYRVVISFSPSTAVVKISPGSTVLSWNTNVPSSIAAKLTLGRGAHVARRVAAFHADLPAYGEGWHGSGPADVWESWLQPWMGKLLSDPAVPLDQPRLKTPEDLSRDEIVRELDGRGVGFAAGEATEALRGKLVGALGRIGR